MHKKIFVAFAVSCIFCCLYACRQRASDAHTVTMLIESSPSSLDPRIGIDAQSEHIDELIFDALVHRDEHFNVQPWLAADWETPDPLTYVFHLRDGVHFHNGQPLTSSDVRWTIDTLLPKHEGNVVSVKAGSFVTVDHIDAPDPLTVIFHLKKPDPTLLWNLSNGAIGILPAGSKPDFWRHPIGTGPFRFVSQQADQEVILDRNPGYWQAPASIDRVRFAVVPDMITRALELRKGSADICVNALSADMYHALQGQPQLVIESMPGTVLNYVGFNLRDRTLTDVRVRQAIAYAIDRPLIVHFLWHDRVRLAESLLPPNHWAWYGGDEHEYDPQRAVALLDSAGYKPDGHGIRMHLTIKTSTDETVRLLAIVFQQQLRQVGIALDVRSYEFATFASDVAKGAFQMYTLRWSGGNESPDIFRYAYATASFPPKGANRGHYSNPQMDRLIAEASASSDRAIQKRDYQQVQQILSTQVPSVNLWYLDTVAVHNRRLTNVRLSSSGDYEFLREALLTP